MAASRPRAAHRLRPSPPPAYARWTPARSTTYVPGASIRAWTEGLGPATVTAMPPDVGAMTSRIVIGRTSKGSFTLGVCGRLEAAFPAPFEPEFGHEAGDALAAHVEARGLQLLVQEGLFWDVALHPQHLDLALESGELLALGRRQRACGSTFALAAVDVRLPNARANRRLCQLQIARDLSHRPVACGDQSNDLRHVLRREGPSPPLLRDHEPPVLSPFSGFGWCPRNRGKTSRV